MFSLQNYTTYSIYSGLMEPSKWAKRASKLNYPALGVCEKFNMDSHVEFQKECEKHDIKPIFGEEVRVYKDAGKKETDCLGNVLLYAKNEKGYENLISINNFAHKRLPDGGGFYYRPRVDLKIISAHSEGLICVSPPLYGVGTSLTENDNLSGVKYLYQLQEIFADDLYVGVNEFITSVEECDEKTSTQKIIVDLVEAGFKTVPVANCHYPEKDQHYLYEVVRNIDRASSKRMENFEREIYDAYLPDFESLDVDTSSLEEICDKCDYRIPLGTYFMPGVKTKYGSTKADLVAFIGEEFKRKVYPEADFDVLKDVEELRKYGDKKPREHIVKGEPEDSLQDINVYVDQLVEEMKVIEEKGFYDYFHIVQDMCSYIDKIRTGRGFGRGSAAGSLFSYMLNITNGVDPIRHDLYFERFMNPDRNDLPDIDLDFSKKSKAELLKYLRKKYGDDRVVLIGTHGRLKVASAVKAVHRAYAGGVPANDGEIISYDKRYMDNVLDSFVKQTSRGQDELNERLEYEDFKNFYELHSDWFDEVIMPLQETVTQTSVHAGGVLILPEDKPASKVMPCYYHADYGKVTQWKDRHCEERGFPKFDLLVIDATGVTAEAKKLVEDVQGKKVPDIEHVPLDDALTLKKFYEAETDGVAQFQTYVQQKLLQELKPESFEHLVAAVALGRPGPMGVNAHTDYAKRKNGLQAVEYDHPDLEPILGPTYGLMIYQEQMMKVCTDIAGMTGSEADYVRKACGKKKIKKMKKWRDVFIDGCVDNGYDREFAEDIWEKIEYFAEYSFNKSHATAYALIGYYQMYIRVRYPQEYWAAALRFAYTTDKKQANIYNFREKATEDGVKFIFPNIHGYAKDYYPASDGESIFWPLVAIKGVGEATSDTMCLQKQNSYGSIPEMMESIDTGKVHKGVVKTLIKAGFFDPLGSPLEAIEKYNEYRASQNMDLIDHYSMQTENDFAWEKMKNEAFGMQVRSWKDVAPFQENISQYTQSEFKKVPDGELIFIGGMVESIQIRQTKHGGWYAKVFITDLHEKYKIMFWSDFWDNPELPRHKRPREGQLIELIGQKGSWSPPDSNKIYHSVEVGSPNNYVNIVWDVYEE